MVAGPGSRWRLRLSPTSIGLIRRGWTRVGWLWNHRTCGLWFAGAVMSARAPYLFISYRKADTRHAAGRLYSDLERELAPSQVFWDKERLEGGDAWPERLRTEVERATVMLVLIGKLWLTEQDPNTGDRRLNVPGDWVRTEIELGLQAGLIVAPVLVDGAAPLKVSSLQTVPSIKKLEELQWLRLRDEDWKSDIAALKKYLINHGFVRRTRVQRMLGGGVAKAERPPTDESPVGHTNGAESVEPYIVGREYEVGLLQKKMAATRSPSILNIFGPAGIGKTTLCDKLSGWCKSQQIPSARVDLDFLRPVTVKRSPPPARQARKKRCARRRVERSRDPGRVPRV